jgi:hypothetical protein
MWGRSTARRAIHQRGWIIAESIDFTKFSACNSVLGKSSKATFVLQILATLEVRFRVRACFPIGFFLENTRIPEVDTGHEVRAKRVCAVNEKHESDNQWPGGVDVTGQRSLTPTRRLPAAPHFSYRDRSSNLRLE